MKEKKVTITAKGASIKQWSDLILALFALSACSVGQKCTYTQEGTKISSWIWIYGSDKPVDLDKMNCN